jgi:hypothetical protein
MRATIANDGGREVRLSPTVSSDTMCQHAVCWASEPPLVRIKLKRLAHTTIRWTNKPAGTPADLS